jgi:hypothetical protein
MDPPKLQDTSRSNLAPASALLSGFPNPNLRVESSRASSAHRQTARGWAHPPLQTLQDPVFSLSPCLPGETHQHLAAHVLAVLARLVRRHERLHSHGGGGGGGGGSWSGAVAARGAQPRLRLRLTPASSAVQPWNQGCWEAFCDTGSASAGFLSLYNRAQNVKFSPAKVGFTAGQSSFYCRPRPAAQLLSHQPCPAGDGRLGGQGGRQYGGQAA